MSDLPVELSWFELHMAAMIGVRRQIEAFRAGRHDLYGAARGRSGRGWHLHVEGAAGEMAFAKLAGHYYAGSIDTFKAGGDVGRIQVRTRSRHEYELIVRDSDRDEDVFVLMTGTAPAFLARGWLRGRDAKRPEWLRDYGGASPAYFPPQAVLLPIEALPDA